jgi:hypothetical protein
MYTEGACFFGEKATRLSLWVAMSVSGRLSFDGKADTLAMAAGWTVLKRLTGAF